MSNSIYQGLLTFFRTVREILRELGDERAYARHLAWHGRAHSQQEWISFSEQRHRSRFGNPKCC